MTGPVFSNGGSILVTGGGSIGRGAEGVFADNCSITTLSNMGSIGAASGAPGRVAGTGVRANSGETINLLNNAAGATISGGKGGNRQHRRPGGDRRFERGNDHDARQQGAILAAVAAAACLRVDLGGAGVSNSGGITRLTNTGTITGGLGGGGNTSGAVGFGGAGIVNSGTIRTLTNSGTIGGGMGGSTLSGGGGGAGVSNSGTIKALTNNGTINGGAGGGTISSANIGGAGGAGVSNASGATITSLENAKGTTISGGDGEGALRAARAARGSETPEQSRRSSTMGRSAAETAAPATSR